jgi:CubicO group peptidase (beta-lactamase class C family)
MELRYGSPDEAGMSSAKISELEALQQYWVNQGVSPIIVSLVARRGVIVSHKMFVDPGYDQTYGPMKLDTIFQLASIAKAVTGTAVMMLIERGQVAAGLPVQDYIPEFAGEHKDKVLIHHLLTHTSGIDESKSWELMQSGAIEIDMDKCPNNQHPDEYKYLTASYHAPLAFFPGKEMQYCSTGFTILAEIIRRVTGQTIHEFATEHIFKPLGMNDTYFSLPEHQDARVAKHPPNAPFPRFADYANLRRTGLSSTVYDMAAFCQMLLNGGSYKGKRILSKIGVEKMTTNQIPGVAVRYGDEFFLEACWGLGWNVSGNKHDYTGTLRSPRTFSHSGRGNTQIMVDPVNQIITVNFQVTMKRINNRPYHYFEYFNDAVLASIDD